MKFINAATIVALLAAALTLCSCSVNADEGSKSTNIVFLLADDLGWRDLGCYGATDIRTPHIDRLAAEGVCFTQFYSNGPECTPTRTAFLTGRYQQRVGGLECAIGLGGVGRYEDAIRLANQQDLGLPASEQTLSQILRKKGYATAIVGKWHLGYEDKFSPNMHGFDFAFYAQGGGMDYFRHVEDPPDYLPVLRLNGRPIERRGYFTELVANEAVRWLNEYNASNESAPFFLYVPFTAPHSPYQGPDDAGSSPLTKDSEQLKQGKAHPEVYAAMIESMDQAVGRILNTIKAMGAVKNTLVVFTSDNGGTASARPTGLRGLKGSTFEGGIRVPCLVRWPGELPGRATYDYPAVTFDLTASLLRIARATADRKLDGIDILRHIAAGEPPASRQLFWRQRRGDVIWRGARDGNWKLVIETRSNMVNEFLFDLTRDVAEASNLSETHPQVADRMKKLLAAWEIEVRPHR